jgi:hypothetical protein
MRSLGPRPLPARSRALLLLLSGLAACHAKRAAPEQVSAPSASAAPAPVDHLAPGELASGNTEVYGFPVPRGMEVESRLVDRTYLSGRVSPEALSNYVRQQVTVSHVEIGAARTVFPLARINAGPPDRVYNFEVLPDEAGTRLVIKDVTPPPPPPPGLSDAERWRAAGLTPDGRPLDPKKLE